MFEDLKKRFRSFTNFISPRAQGLARRAVDVVSPNTPQDIARRQAAGQPASYQAQQAQLQAQRDAARARVQALKPTQRIISVTPQQRAFEENARIAQQGIAAGQRPSYGEGIGGLFRRAQDVVSADTAQDIYNRAQQAQGLMPKGTITTYEQQQRALGNIAPASNPLEMVRNVAVGTTRDIAKSGIKTGLTIGNIASQKLFPGTQITAEYQPTGIAKTLLGKEKIGTISAYGREVGLPGARSGKPAAVLGGILTALDAAPLVGGVVKQTLSKVLPLSKSLALTTKADDIVRILDQEGIQVTDDVLNKITKSRNPKTIESELTKSIEAQTARDAAKAAEVGAKTTVQDLGRGIISGAQQTGARNVISALAPQRINDNLITELQKTRTPQQAQDAVKALFPDKTAAEQSRIATELANTKDAAVIRKTLEDAQTRRTAVSEGIQQAVPTAPARQAEAIQQAAEAPAIAAPTPRQALPEAQIAGVPPQGADVNWLSANAKNSLINDTTGIKPGGIQRSGTRVENATAKPVEYRRLEDGSIAIVDGRHTLEYARQKGITDFPIVDVTDQYLPKKQLAQLPKSPQRAIENTYPADIPLAITNKESAASQFLTAMNDKDSAIINYLKRVEKETGQTGLVDQFYYDSGLLNRSNSIANAQVRASDNLRQAFQGLSGAEKNAFDNYVAIRNEISNAERGLKTAIPLNELRAQEAQLAGQFGNRFASLNNYYKEWATQMRSAGLISQDTFNEFVANNDYTRIQRVMDDLAKPSVSGGKAYSLRTTLAKQKRTGSLREIQPADLTAFDYAQKVQKEIQRNQVASNLLDVLLEQKVARPVPASQAARKNIMARIVDGKTQLFEVPKDIKELVDNISPYQLGVLQQIISTPNRLFKAGTTTLNPVFTAINYGKDQLSLAVFGRNFRATHNPGNMVSALFSAAKDFGGNASDPLWQKFISVAGDTTQFDLLRNAGTAKGLSREVRLGRIGKGVEKIRNPIRTLEDFNSITEKATRFQNFKGVYKDVLKKTGNEVDAMRAATLAAWQDTVDFNRAGNIAQALNLVLPYFNSSIQGTRLIGRSFVERPGATTGKVLSFVALPLTALTLHNLADPNTRKIYENISDYEKENNFIIVLPNAKQNKDGSYDGVIKIPIQQGLSNLVQPFRMTAENYAKTTDQNSVKQMAQEFIGAFSGPVDTTNLKAAMGTAIPQAFKPALQQYFNVDLYTGKPIVPKYIQEATTAEGQPVPEAQKAYDYSSGTARKIGQRFGWSPIRIEKFIKDTTGKVGLYVLNASDNLLAKKGIIPDEQIGGLSIKEDFTKRIFKAQGEYNYAKPASAKYFDIREAAVKSLNKNERAAYDALHPDKSNFLGEKIFDENKRFTAATRAGVYLQFPKVFEADKAIEMEMRKQGNPANPIYDLSREQLTRVLLKATLPPGAKDPELSKLYQQEWYQDYQANRSKYYEAIKTKFAAEGKTLPPSTNPYPTTPPDVQGAMDYYSSLPKGTGQRSAFIRNYPDVWAKMTSQWAAVDAWENKERIAMGLSPTEGLQATGQTGGFGGGFGGGGPQEQRQYLTQLLGQGVNIAQAPEIKATPTRFKVKVQKPSKGKKARIRLG